MIKIEKNKRGALQISFAWLFAIIVGAVILFFEIFLSSRIINLGTTESDTKLAKQILVLFNPLESSFETDKATSFTLASSTRIYNSCDSSQVFGQQKLRVSQKTMNKWSDTGLNVSFENKYLFSEDPLEGKKFYIFSKPFEMGFKVADLIYLTSDSKEYCFQDMPDSELKESIGYMNSSNPKLKLQDCAQDSVKVCFREGTNCDMEVYENSDNKGYVQKEGENLYFTNDALMMAAIFSDPVLYECQVKRLMQRTSQLAKIYADKEVIIQNTGCESNLRDSLEMLVQQASHVSNSQGLSIVYDTAKEIQDRNSMASCKLW